MAIKVVATGLWPVEALFQREDRPQGGGYSKSIAEGDFDVTSGLHHLAVGGNEP